MTDGPQLCALPGCSETVEQPNDGGPRRLYCSPAHRAAARKARHAARMEASAAQPAAEVAQSEEVTQPIVKAPDGDPSEQPTTELPAALGTPRGEEPQPAPVPDREWSPAAAWSVSPPALPSASQPSARKVRTITSQRVKKQKPARTAAERKNAGTHMRRRAIASVAIASLVAGGASYFVTNNVIPTGPTPLPPQAANEPSMDADVWADKAQVTLASLSSQLDAVAQAEASWLALPAQRRAQEPAAVQALKDRKTLLEQQRTALMSQLEAFKALPDRTAELTSAQAQLDAVERTLAESTSTAASPDYQEALRQLESQRDIRRQQRDHAAQALTDLRNGVEQALSSPLPADKDKTTRVVERVKAVVAGRPDPGEKNDGQEHKAADRQEPATTPRRDDDDEERGDVGTTAPPDPERPNTPDILADGGSPAANAGERDGGDKPDGDKAAGADGESEGPVRSVAGALGSALGQGDTTNRDESANKRDSRGDDGSDRNDDNGGRSGLGDVVRGVGGALLGGSSDNDDHGDSDARRERNKERDDDGDDRGDNRNDHSSWLSDRGDRDDDRSDRGGDDDRDRGSDRDDDDHHGIRGIADRLLGGDDDDDDRGDKADRDDDGDHKRPSGKAERKRDKDREESKNRHHKGDSDDDDSDDDDKKDRDKKDRDDHKDDDDGDHKKKDSDDDSDKKSDHGDKDDDDGGKSDKKSDKGDDDGGDSGDGDDD